MKYCSRRELIYQGGVVFTASSIAGCIGDDEEYKRVYLDAMMDNGALDLSEYYQENIETIGFVRDEPDESGIRITDENEQITHYSSENFYRLHNGGDDDRFIRFVNYRTNLAVREEDYLGVQGDVIKYRSDLDSEERYSLRLQNNFTVTVA